MTTILAFLAGAVVMYLGLKGGEEADASTQPRFGLKQAEAAEQYANTEDQRRAAMAVAMGVLGCVNAVAEDTEELAADLTAQNEVKGEVVAENKQAIAELEGEIQSLSGQMAANTATMATARERAGKWAS